MKALHKFINKKIKPYESDKKLLDMLNNNLVSPFKTENVQLSYLLSKNIITISDYAKLQKEFLNRNKYLYLFDMAPRTFGQTWGETHILNLFPKFIKATKKNLKKLYPKFSGEFDLWINGLRIEVKAARANFDKGDSSLTDRAYSHTEAKKNKFAYHFQQLKPSCCDLFIWIGVCRDKLLYWIIDSKEVSKHKKFTPQHRNEIRKKNKEIYEGQIWLTEEELSKYNVKEKDVLNTIIKRS